MTDGPDKYQIGWISGMPRSGTTWLSQIFASSPAVRLKSCPLYSYEFKNLLDETSTAKQWEKLFSDVYRRKSEFLDQEHLRKNGLIPRFENKNINPGYLIIKSNRFHNLAPHILELNETIKFIHVVRNPCATLYSWLSDPREFPEHANPLEEWRSGRCRKTGPGEFWGFDDWKTVTTQALSLSKCYPDRYRIIRYEHLAGDTLRYAKDLFEFMQLPFDTQTIDFIKLSHSRHDDDKHSVFKKPELRVKWEEELNPEIISQCLSEIKDTELEQFI